MPDDDRAASCAVLVTGGSSGLGLETVRCLAASQAASHVIMACRDVDRGAAAAGGLAAGRSAVRIIPLDLASLDSVRALPDALAAAGVPPLSALVCNAGVQVVSGTRFTADGVEETFGVNVLGHFLLAHLLVPSMMAGGRLVFVSSGTHDPSQQTGMPAPIYDSARELAAGTGMPDKDPGTQGRRRYTTSKLCDIYLAYEFARRFPLDGPQEPRVTSMAMDPGLMPGSGLARDYGRAARFAWRHILPHLTRFRDGINTAQTSGSDLAALALDPRYAGETGRYFVGTRAARSSELSYDRDNAADLWATCCTLTGVSASRTRDP